MATSQKPILGAFNQERGILNLPRGHWDVNSIHPAVKPRLRGWHGNHMRRKITLWNLNDVIMHPIRSLYGSMSQPWNSLIQVVIENEIDMVVEFIDILKV